jgi:threonine/homoserine/homoserine lactone efflux protein
MLTTQQTLLYLPAVALIIATPGQDMLMRSRAGFRRGGRLRRAHSVCDVFLTLD